MVSGATYGAILDCDWNRGSSAVRGDRPTVVYTLYKSVESDFCSVEDKQDVSQLDVEALEPETDHRCVTSDLLDGLITEVRQFHAKRL